MKIKNKFQNILNLISNVMEAYTTALFLSDEKGESVELYCYQSFCRKIDEKCVIKTGEGIIGWVYREKKNVIATNFERNTKTLGFYKEDEKIKSLMAVPLPGGFGVLFVDSKKSYIFTEEKEKIFKQFSQLIYDFICEQNKINSVYLNDKYYSFSISVEKYMEENFNFEKISSLLFKYINLSHFIFVVPGQHVFIYLYDEDKKRDMFFENYPSYYSPEGLIGWCIKNKKNLVSNNLNTTKSFLLNENEKIDIKNFVGIPVYDTKTSLSGALGFVKKTENDTFSTEKIYWNKKEVDFLEIFSKKIFLKKAKEIDLNR